MPFMYSRVFTNNANNEWNASLNGVISVRWWFHWISPACVPNDSTPVIFLILYRFFSEQFKNPPLQCLQLRSVFRNIKTAISLLPEFPMRYTLSEYCMNRNIAYAHSYYFPVIWILRSYDFRYHAPITLMIKQQCHITIMGLFKKINLFEFLAESLFESIFGLNYCSDKTNQRQFWTMNRLIAVMPCLWFTLIPV